jgi:hypothetical protein
MSPKLAPGWVTGFTDAEGSFFVTIFQNKEYKCGWQVQATYSITLHGK